MCTKYEGNEIRTVPGLDEVGFLTDIVTIKVRTSYVFGLIIKLLCDETVGYFTKTMERIERMYVENDETPIILICHSMGCKTGHYLLNFVLEKLGAVHGREWINTHVHTYMPLGVPHLGAPSLVNAAFMGSLNPMADPMLSLEERLVSDWSIGSVAWLLFCPKHLDPMSGWTINVGSLG